MATTPRSMPAAKAIGKGTVSNRWNLIIEIAKKPYAASLEQFHQRFHVTEIRELRNATRLLTQWTFDGWTPVIKGDKQWNYKKSFEQNRHQPLISEAGMRFANLLELTELAENQPKFSDVFDLCQHTVQKIRCHVYEERWEKYASGWLSGSPLPFRTKYDEQAILTDLFRLLCFDFLVRKGTLSSEEICIISNVVQEPVRYGVSDLDTFRRKVDLESQEIQAGRLVVTMDGNWTRTNSYHFHEFVSYKETYGIKIFSTVEGDFKTGFQYNKAQDCFTELLQRLG